MALLDTELSKDDFKETTTRMILFSKGTDYGFEWKEYCPTVFRIMLELDNIDFNDYMQSICGDEHLTHVLSSGKCSPVFVSSLDDRFVIKMLRKDELKIMLEILPNYYRHLKTYKGSLLSKLYGLHYVRLDGGLKVYFAVTSNVMKSNLPIHKCYDLKGAIGRNNLKLVTDNLCIQKDEDFDFSFYLDPLVRCRLLRQIKYDCEFLEAEGIMDYSFMLSIHIVAQHEGSLNCKRSIGGGSFNSERSSTNGSCSSDMMADTYEGNYDVELSLSYLCSPSERYRNLLCSLYKLQPTRKLLHINSRTMKDILRKLHNNFRCSTIENFGAEMPALAIQTHKNADGGVSLEEYYDVILYFSIVDIFQRYNMIKRIEHVYKSLQYRSGSIGAVNPKLYSCRFQDFLKRVFLSADSISSHFDDESMSTSSRQSE